MSASTWFQFTALYALLLFALKCLIPMSGEATLLLRWTENAIKFMTSLYLALEKSHLHISKQPST